MANDDSRHAVWVGIGAGGAGLVAVLVRHESTSAAQVVAIVATIGSIVAVKLAAVY